MPLRYVEEIPGKLFVAACDSLRITIEDGPWQVGEAISADCNNPADPFTVLQSFEVDGWAVSIERYGEELRDEINFHKTKEEAFSEANAWFCSEATAHEHAEFARLGLLE